MNGDVKIGKLLCEEDIITKRQLNQALQMQVKGDKRSLGEILVDKGFCTFEDITEVVLANGNGHEEKQEEIAEKVEKPEPVELSEDTLTKDDKDKLNTELIDLNDKILEFEQSEKLILGQVN